MNSIFENEQAKVKKVEKKLSENSSSHEIPSAAEVRAAALQVETSSGAQDILMGMEGNEIREAVSGRSEKKGSSTQGSQSSGTSDEATIRVQLQAQIKIPERKVMVRKVKTAVLEEMQILEKEIKHLKKIVLKSAQRLADVVQKLRNLKEILRSVATYAIEFLKKLYEKVMKRESLA
ncbi:hypothetical protein HZA38_00600 [Candidatus Peregrinibacteria bacterium]|nr:hypothetical protein [Candidatus Peregrinibacteria bacterium]